MSYLDFVSATSWVNLTPLFPVPVDIIMKEIYQVETMFNEERDQQQNQKLKQSDTIGIGTRLDGQKNWSAMTLLSASGDYKDILTQGILTNENKKVYIKSFRNLRDHKWTELCDHMPNTTKFIKDTLGPLMKLSYVKISKLEPGGDIPQHEDIPEVDFDFKNTTNTYNMLNSILIELNCPAGTTAYHDGQKLNYQKGSVFMCNQSKKHGTSNTGNSNRYNMRIQGLYNKKFRDLIKQKIKILDVFPKDAVKFLNV